MSEKLASAEARQAAEEAKELAIGIIDDIARQAVKLFISRNTIDVDELGMESADEAANDVVCVLTGVDPGCLDPDNPEELALIEKPVNDLAAIIADSYADIVRERDAWQTLFYESEEENCSCNVVDTTKPVGDPYNYVCQWHEENPRITDAREVVLTLAERAEAAERLNSELVEAKNGAYAERDKLVAALSKVFPAHLCRHPVEDKSWENDWRWIVCIHAPTGQMTWHIHDSEREMFDHLEIKEQHWDGHSTEEKYVRLAAIKSATAKQGEQL